MKMILKIKIKKKMIKLNNRYRNKNRSKNPIKTQGQIHKKENKLKIKRNCLLMMIKI